MKTTRKKVNYRLPPDVLKAISRRAKQDKASETGVVEAALRVYLGVYPSWVPQKSGGDHAAR